jgi:hypothetical protein
MTARGFGLALALAGGLATTTAAQPAAPADQGAETSAGPAPATPLYDGSPGSSVESAFQTAEAARGALDGRWRLSDAMGAPLYDFLLADRGAAPPDPLADADQPQVEGAWRDLRRRGAIEDAGPLDAINRRGATLVLRFQEPTGPRTISLDRLPSGVWIGRALIDGEPRVVFLERL